MSKLTTLDLIEECLDLIQRCRKESLLSRARKFQQKEASRRRRLRSSQERLRTPNRKTHQKEDLEDEEEDDITTEIIGQKLAQKVKSVPLQSPLPLLASSSIQNFMNSLNPNPVLPNSPKIGSNDSIAMKVAREFQEALIQWWRDNPTKRSDEDARIEFADYLSDLYLCQKLDGLPSSPIISSSRKEISNYIEDFAANGIVPDNFNALKFDHLQEGSQTSSSPPGPTITANKSNQPQINQVDSSPSNASLLSLKPSSSLPPPSAANAALNSTFSSSKYKTNPNHSKAPATEEESSKASTASTASTLKGSQPLSKEEQKKQAEKERIKKQYEEFMKQKSQAEKNKEKEYEDLNDDIRSLLTSLKK